MVFDLCSVGGVTSRTAAWAWVRERPSGGERSPEQPRLHDRVHRAIRLRHCGRRTEKAYAGWIRRFVLFHFNRLADETGADEVTKFLSHLAVTGQVSASTQNQALSALLFLYRDVLRRELAWMDTMVRARRPVRLPVVLARGEVAALLRELSGTRSPPTCSRTATTPAPSRNCSVTATSAPR